MLLIDIRSTNASAAEFILYRLKLYLAGRHHHHQKNSISHPFIHIILFISIHSIEYLSLARQPRFSAWRKQKRHASRITKGDLYSRSSFLQCSPSPNYYVVQYPGALYFDLFPK